MQFWQQVHALIRKDLMLEWRNRYALNGVLLYVILIVFTIFLSFQQVDTRTWNTLLWIVLVFTAVNSITKSFIGESYHRNLYYYLIASPRAVMVAKTIYNTALLMVVTLLATLSYSFVLGFPVVYPMYFLLSLILGTIGLSGSLTMVAAIASRADHATALMAVLGLPILLPMLVLLIAISQAGFEELTTTLLYRNYLLLLTIDAVVAALGLLLFPYLWRD
jgi:heme exporter protein B